MMKRTALITLALLLLAIPALATVSQDFQIQGVLTDNNGVVLDDGDYSVNINIYDASTGGLLMWSDTVDAIQEDGVFTAMLYGFYPNTFDRDTWMELTVDGEPTMVPRIPIHPVPVALSASTVDPANAVVGLNGKKGNVTLVGGTNVTVVPSGSSNEITINATTGAGGDDGDWEVSGTDIYRSTGRVIVGEAPALAKGNKLSGPDGADGQGMAGGMGEDGTRLPATGKMKITGENEGLYVAMNETDSAEDGRAAIFGRLNSTSDNDGTGLTMNGSNSAVTGLNYSDGGYSFGVGAFNYTPSLNSGALVAHSTYIGATALGYKDGDGNNWGVYSEGDIRTPNVVTTGDVDVGDDITVSDNANLNNAWINGILAFTPGAADGYILTSNAAGMATWSPPAAATNDGDWTVSGNHVYHSEGSAGIGTSTVRPWVQESTRTTMQVQALFYPTLALDRIGIYPNNELYRWTMSGGTDGLKFNLSNDYDSEGTTALHLDEGKLQLNRATGETAIVMEGDGVDALGPSLHIYSTSPSTTAPLISLDPQNGTHYGGIITLRDGNGVNQVELTANHNNTGVGRVTTPVLEITGGSDLSEQFDIGNNSVLTRHAKIEPGMVVSIDPENPGGLTLSGKAYDRRVAGVISGAGGVNTGMVMGQQGSVADGEHPVALVGRVYVWADASDGPIEPGDLLTSSDRPGHAMKVTDHAQATGAILGKAMTGLDEGQGLILTLVTLQ